MNIPYFRVSAFTTSPYGGNPAGVCLPDAFPADEVMQAVAKENGLAETAWCVRRDDESWDLRWFTPALEIDLCGHATLATAHILWQEQSCTDEPLRFHTRSGELTVHRDGDRSVLDFPSRPAEPMDTPAGLADILGTEPVAVGHSRDLLVELADENAVRSLTPNIPAMAALDYLGIIVTACGAEADFVSRFFAPRAGIDEDPVTGSAHCTLVPWWAERLDRDEMTAHQVSTRFGDLACRLAGDRVQMGGHAVTYQRGEVVV
ncbi:MAG: PhzF family phenazine biosynthesis protein [bacterium]|nr:PhzF family phenazine biosynthesis protein [bacterium]